MVEKILLTYPELRLIGIRFSRAHVNRLIANGVFPKPIRLGGPDNAGKAYWRLVDIMSFIEQRAIASGLPPSSASPVQSSEILGFGCSQRPSK
jgi:predicted DNA-binding transcriptional regulator AlpA